jgi:hypothetical protein
MATIRANAAVSNAVLKALGSGNHHTISNAEWGNIKKTALSQVRSSSNPKQTANDIKKSLVLGNKAADGDIKDRIRKFIKDDLADAVKTRQATLRGNSVSSWSGYGGRTTTRRTTYSSPS